MPNLNSIQRAAQAQFTRQSECYARGHVLENVEDVEAALKIIGLPIPGRVLDVATGAGHTGLHLASLGHHVTLSDLTEPMLQRARKAAERRNLAVKFRQHPAEEMPFPSGHFDLVTCRSAAHHFSSPERFIREVVRVLKPGGSLLLIDRTVEDGQLEAEAWLHEIESLRDPSHQGLLPPKTWRQLCELAGLTVRHCELTPFKQPDLNQYFETAATPREHRARILALIEQAPESVRRLLRLGTEGDRVVWWWQHLTLIACKEGLA